MIKTFKRMIHAGIIGALSVPVLLLTPIALLCKLVIVGLVASIKEIESLNVKLGHLLNT